MKNVLKFLGIFAVCAAGLYLFLAVIGIHQFRGHIALIIGVGLLLAGLVTAILHLVRRVGELEYRSELLEYKVGELEKNKDQAV